jgi:hypothetical protein
MHGAHLRLEAVRVEVARSAVPCAVPGTSGGALDWSGSASRRSRAALALDRRSAALARGLGQGQALVGFAVLPWCDVTLWSVPDSAGASGSPREASGHEAHTRPPVEARAWMRVELGQVDWALAYVERLPVRESLVSKPWRWRWSSAPWHCGFGIKPAGLAPEWTGPVRSDLWRERLAGAFVDRSDRSVDLVRMGLVPGTAQPRIEGSAVDRLARRAMGHSPGMPSASGAAADAEAGTAVRDGVAAGDGAAIEPSHGELAVA